MIQIANIFRSINIKIFMEMFAMAAKVYVKWLNKGIMLESRGNMQNIFACEFQYQNENNTFVF